MAKPPVTSRLKIGYGARNDLPNHKVRRRCLCHRRPGERGNQLERQLRGRIGQFV